MRPVVLLPGIVIVVLLSNLTVNACTCGGNGAPCESYGTASAVFAGTVISERINEPTKQGERPKIDDIDWHPRAFKFSVQQAYSGVTGTEVEVFTGRGGGDCGYSFQIGQRYLVYAHSYQNKLTTSICSRTRLFSKATEDLAFLGTLSSARPGATIHGAVISEDRKDESLSSDILITIEGESQRKEIRPDAEGRYRVSGLPPGKYKVTLHLPDALTTYKNENEITVADRGCGAVGWYISDNGRVNGRVVNPSGEPVARILVGLIDPGAESKEYPVKLERTDDEGNFKFSGVPRGRYLITVNHVRFPEADDPTKGYPPTYYPGVIDKEQAQAITVGPGEKLNDLVVRVPAKQPPSVVKVSVVWADGSPVAKASVNVTDVTHGESSSSYSVPTDAQGRATIDGYIGQKLIISAGSDRPWVPSPRNEPMERAENLRLTLDRPTQTIRIVITKLR